MWEYSEEAQPTFYEDGKAPQYAFRKVRIVYAEVIE